MSFVAIQVSRVFTNSLGDQDSIPGRVLSKTQKMALDASLINTQHSNPRKGVAPSPHLNVEANKKGAFGSPSTTVTNFTYLKQKVNTLLLIYYQLHNIKVYNKNLKTF